MDDWWTSANAWMAKPLTRGDLIVGAIVVGIGLFQTLSSITKLLEHVSRQVAAVAKLIRPDEFDDY